MKILYTVIFWMATSTFALAHPTSFAPLVKKTSPAVVSISGERDIDITGTQGNVQGSGFIYSKSGYIITNNHVVNGMQKIVAILEDGTELDAEIIGLDPLTDLAVIKIIEPTDDLPTLQFGDSDEIYVGDWVIAIGNPLRLGGTVTKGIVSARSRNIELGLYDDYIQTDAPINRGNSGGPLINMDGEVVGINTAILSPSGGSVGLGFSIPSNLVKYVATQLIENGRVVRGWIGISFEGITPDIAESIDLPDANGTLVVGVIKNSPAERANLRTGDVILDINGTKITRKKRLPGIIAMSPIGEKIPLKVWRKGKILDIEVILVERKKDIAGLQQEFGDRGQGSLNIKELGINVSNLTPQVAEEYGIDPNEKGVVITAHLDTNTGKISQRALPIGALIVMINNIETPNIETVQLVIEDAVKRNKRQVMFVLQSPNGSRLIVTVPLNK